MYLLRDLIGSLGYLCSLWLAGVFTVNLILWHSFEKHSNGPILLKIIQPLVFWHHDKVSGYGWPEWKWIAAWKTWPRIFSSSRVSWKIPEVWSWFVFPLKKIAWYLSVRVLRTILVWKKVLSFNFSVVLTQKRKNLRDLVPIKLKGSGDRDNHHSSKKRPR